MNNSADGSSAPSLARFGEPDVVFRPTFGQTTAGIVAGAAWAVAAVAWALLADGILPSARIAIVGVGMLGLGFAYWVYRLRKWQLAICPGGLIQSGAWGVDEVAWSDVYEIVETRIEGSPSPYKVTVLKRTGSMVVRAINCRRRSELFEVLLEAAKRREIPVRITWVQAAD